MTFEKFKNQFEKINTSESQTMSDEQYQWYVLSLEDDKFFEPLISNLNKLILADYEENLNSILGFDQISENQIIFLVQPSFQPEILLKIQKTAINYQLTLNSLTKNYWFTYNANRSVTIMDTISSEAHLSTEIGDKLFRIIENAMLQAKTPVKTKIILDGVKFKFSKLINGKRIDVFKHSPNEYSQTGKIISLMHLLINYVASDLIKESEANLWAAIQLLSNHSSV